MAGSIQIATAYVAVSTQYNPSGLQLVQSVVQRVISRVSAMASRAFGSIAGHMDQMARSGTAAVINMSTQIWNLLLPAILAIIAALPMMYAIFLLLAPTLLVAGGAAGSLFTLIAGGIGLVATLKMAFSGVGDAIGEVFEKGKASHETLKKLSPAAREFVKAFEGIRKPLADLKKSVQEKVFSGLAAPFKSLAQTWLPQLKPMLGDLADRVNVIGKNIMTALGKPDFIANIKTAMKGFGDFLERLGASIPGLIDAFGRLAARSAPFLKKIGELIGGVFDKFSAWIKKADESGALTSFMDKAVKSLQDLWDIAGLVFGIVGEIIEILFPGSEREADTIFAGIKEQLQVIKDWLADPANQQKIQEWIDKIQDFADKLANEWIPKAIEWIEKIAEWVSKVENWVNTIKGWKDKLAETWESIKQKAEEIWNGIVDFFTGLPGRIGTALSELPGKVREKVSEMAQTALTKVGEFIGTVIMMLIMLPLKAAIALMELPGKIREKFQQAKDFATQKAGELVSGAVSFLSQLPGRAASAISNLPGQVANVFNNARNNAVNTISGMVGTVASIAGSIPGRVAGAIGSLGGVLVGAGRSLIQGLINGIEGKLGELRGLLNRITGMIPDWKGPMDRDRRLLEPTGRALMGGLMRGIGSEIPALRDQLGGLTGEIGAMARSGVRGGAVAAGPTYRFEPGSIVLDASKIKDFQELLNMITGVQRSARQFGATVTAR